METKDYLQILAEEIHSVVVATVDDNGLPATRVIDIMLHDDESVYFLTAKGKAFYKQLTDKGYISLSGITAGKGSMAKKSISIAGSVKNVGSETLDKIFEVNPYMATIYPTMESRTALEVFCLYKGQGEYFDLTTKPITRASFALGGSNLQKFGYLITGDCTACGKCVENCPTNCIEESKPYVIHQENCLHCGNCKEVCPSGAVLQL